MKLIIQIPCYNEEETLKETLDDLPKEIEGIDKIEYLIINDGSSDKTIEIASNWGVNYIIDLKINKGLAKCFMAGIDASLRYGADIIVNTDGDNQYSGKDIPLLLKPILEGKADIVIGERPMDSLDGFSTLKRELSKFGSFVVRLLSGTNIPDAPSGFRAMTREAALRLNVTNDYTYTLETIFQAGHKKIPMTSVPIHTNKVLRPSRLFSSIFGYVRKSMIIMIRTYIMYRPLKFFTFLSIFMGFISVLISLILGRWNIYLYILLLSGFITFILGFVADSVSKNRIILEDIQYHIRKLDYDIK